MGVTTEERFRGSQHMQCLTNTSKSVVFFAVGVFVRVRCRVSWKRSMDCLGKCAHMYDVRFCVCRRVQLPTLQVVYTMLLFWFWGFGICG